MKEKILTFLKSTFSEADGTGSASRVLGAAVVLSTLAWVSYVVLKHGAIPDLTGPSVFVGSGSSFYGLNKLSDAFKKKE